MPFIGKTPTAVPLTANDIAADIINSTHIGDTAISGFDALATAPADTDELLISDAGTLKRIDASLVGGAGIEMADQWRLSATVSIGNSSETTLTGWERPDDTESSLACYGRVGTGMTESSGTFTFPSTGIYLVRFVYGGQTGVESATYGRIYMSKDGSNYDLVSSADQYMSGGFNGKATAEYLADVTSTSNDLMQFRGRVSSGTGQIQGNTDQNITSVTFIRLGDT